MPLERSVPSSGQDLEQIRAWLVAQAQDLQRELASLVATPPTLPERWPEYLQVADVHTVLVAVFAAKHSVSVDYILRAAVLLARCGSVIAEIAIRECLHDDELEHFADIAENALFDSSDDTIRAFHERFDRASPLAEVLPWLVAEQARQTRRYKDFTPTSLGRQIKAR